MASQLLAAAGQTDRSRQVAALGPAQTPQIARVKLGVIVGDGTYDDRSPEQAAVDWERGTSLLNRFFELYGPRQQLEIALSLTRLAKRSRNSDRCDRSILWVAYALQRSERDADAQVLAARLKGSDARPTVRGQAATLLGQIALTQDDPHRARQHLFEAVELLSSERSRTLGSAMYRLAEAMARCGDSRYEVDRRVEHAERLLKHEISLPHVGLLTFKLDLLYQDGGQRNLRRIAELTERISSLCESLYAFRRACKPNRALAHLYAGLDGGSGRHQAPMWRSLQRAMDCALRSRPEDVARLEMLAWATALVCVGLTAPGSRRDGLLAAVILLLESPDLPAPHELKINGRAVTVRESDLEGARQLISRRDHYLLLTDDPQLDVAGQSQATSL